MGVCCAPITVVYATNYAIGLFHPPSRQPVDNLSWTMGKARTTHPHRALDRRQLKPVATTVYPSAPARNEMIDRPISYLEQLVLPSSERHGLNGDQGLGPGKRLTGRRSTRYIHTSCDIGRGHQRTSKQTLRAVGLGDWAVYSVVGGWMSGCGIWHLQSERLDCPTRDGPYSVQRRGEASRLVPTAWLRVNLTSFARGILHPTHRRTPARSGSCGRSRNSLISVYFLVTR